MSSNLSSVAVAYGAADLLISAALETAKSVRGEAIAAHEAELQRIADEKAAEEERRRIEAEEAEAKRIAEEGGEGGEETAA